MADKYVPIAEVKNMLQSESERRELGYEQRLALEHAQRVAKISVTNAKKLIKELKALEGLDMNDRISCKIADLLPKTAAEVRAIFARENATLEKKEIDAIIDLVQKYIE